MDDSIEGLLKNLKETLNSEPKEKAIHVHEEQPAQNNEKQKSSLFVLNKHYEKISLNHDFLKKKISAKVENEVALFVKEYLSSNDGVECLRECLLDVIKKHDTEMKRFFEEEVKKRIQELFVS